MALAVKIFKIKDILSTEEIARRLGCGVEADRPGYPEGSFFLNGTPVGSRATLDTITLNISETNLHRAAAIFAEEIG